MKELLQKDYIELKIDTDRMTGGKEVALRLRGTEKGGIPWMVILDAEGKALITSDGPDGNIGCPVEKSGRRHFMKMIGRTQQHMDMNDIVALTAELDKFGEEVLSRFKR